MLCYFVGLGGAFCYAGPKLLADIRTGRHWRGSVAEALMALALGTGFSAAFTPWLGFHFPWLVAPNDTALRVVIGLAGNPAFSLPRENDHQSHSRPRRRQIDHR